LLFLKKRFQNVQLKCTKLTMYLDIVKYKLTMNFNHKWYKWRKLTRGNDL